ncbi:hypothetical protein HRS9122_05394 [Pyrenophora teres f. teres]|nr:hypothetical protein HRS9122_05394 [Pyrenophora teres f. teres]
MPIPDLFIDLTSPGVIVHIDVKECEAALLLANDAKPGKSATTRFRKTCVISKEQCSQNLHFKYQSPDCTPSIHSYFDNINTTLEEYQPRKSQQIRQLAIAFVMYLTCLSLTNNRYHLPKVNMSWSIKAVIALVALVLTTCVPFAVYVWRRFRSQRQAARAQPDPGLGNASEPLISLTSLFPVLLRRDTVDPTSPKTTAPKRFRTTTETSQLHDHKTTFTLGAVRDESWAGDSPTPTNTSNIAMNI